MGGEKNPALDFDEEWGLIENCFMKRLKPEPATGHALTFAELSRLVGYLSKRMEKGNLAFGALDDALLEFEASLRRSLETKKITEREHASLVVDYVRIKTRLRAHGVILREGL